MLGLGQIIQTPLDNKQKPQHVVVQHLDQRSGFFFPRAQKHGYKQIRSQERIIILDFD